MQPTYQARFQKVDPYGNLIFIASGKSSDSDELRAFKRLKKLHAALKKEYKDSYLPVYYNNETATATLKFKDWSNLKPKPHDVYKIKFNILVNKRDGNQYLRVAVDDVQFVRKATTQGTLFKFDLSDSDSESDDDNE